MQGTEPHSLLIWLKLSLINNWEFTCKTSSSSSRSVLLILSIELFEPLYSKIAPCMLISFFDILTTKFPFKRKFPWVSDKAVKEQYSWNNKNKSTV